MTDQSFFQSFNARFMGPTEVASTFVPPVQFDTITKKNNSLLVGPRGSGKTTLLKMLHPAALSAYSGKKCDIFRSQADFTGVYIAIDRTWGEQLKFKELGGDERLTELLGRSAFCTHVLSCLVDSMIFRVSSGAHNQRAHGSVSMSIERQSAVTRDLQTGWNLPSGSESLESLSQDLSKRLVEIGTIANIESYLGQEGRSERIKSFGWLFLSLIESISLGVKTFNNACGQNEWRWALLFDELEIAPSWLTPYLLSLLRSTDERLLFKLSLSPVVPNLSEFHTALGAMRGHDYDTVPLWYWEKKQGRQFASNLFSEIARQRGLGGATAEGIFGESTVDVDEGESEDVSRYEAPNGVRFKTLLELYKKDAEFRDYIDNDKQWDLFRIPKMSQNEQAEVRKLITVATHRLAFKKFTEDGSTPRQRRRSRKNPDYYTGADSLFALTEGNPRVIIALIGRLLDSFQQSGSLTVERHKQASEADAVMHGFRMLLRTISYGGVEGEGYRRGLLEFLDPIGNDLSDNLLERKFIAEPILSFRVTDKSSLSDQDAIATALIHGALVLVPEKNGSVILTTVVGSRYRFSYLLAMDYQLPLLLGKSIQLDTLKKYRHRQGRLSFE